MSTPLLHRTLSTRLVREYSTHYELPQQQYPLLELHQDLSLQVSPLQSLENVKSLLLSVARSEIYKTQGLISQSCNSFYENLQALYS